MASISIMQDNKVDGWGLLSIHNPLVFICEVVYDGVTPDSIAVKLESEGALIFEGNAITFKDSAPLTRQYVFVADAFIRGAMVEYDDEVQPSGTLMPIQNITKPFTVTFTHENITASTSFVACHASSQFGDVYGACLKDINEPKTYTAGADGVVYLYIYNWDENNTLSMDTDISVAYAQNSNLDNFTNDNGDKFLIII